MPLELATLSVTIENRLEDIGADAVALVLGACRGVYEADPLERNETALLAMIRLSEATLDMLHQDTPARHQDGDVWFRWRSWAPGSKQYKVLFASLWKAEHDAIQERRNVLWILSKAALRESVEDGSIFAP
jgi:hypothetical protein